MKPKHLISILIIITGLAWGLSLFAQDTHKHAIEETSSAVPALDTFHEVIFPMWHQGYPEKDYALLKSVAPKIAQFAKDLPSIELPGILRDRKPKWEAGVKKFVQAATDYEAAIRANDNARLLAATEKVHSEYEGLVRVIRPVTKELDAYHAVLYMIYHHYLPDMKLAELQSSSAELVNKCGDLMKSTLPERLEGRMADYDKTRTDLCAATTLLAKISQGKDKTAITNAVNDVHTKYQTVEKVFE
jgi:hypothetical protein